MATRRRQAGSASAAALKRSTPDWEGKEGVEFNLKGHCYNIRNKVSFRVLMVRVSTEITQRGALLRYSLAVNSNR